MNEPEQELHVSPPSPFVASVVAPVVDATASIISPSLPHLLSCPRHVASAAVASVITSSAAYDFLPILTMATVRQSFEPID